MLVIPKTEVTNVRGRKKMVTYVSSLIFWPCSVEIGICCACLADVPLSKLSRRALISFIFSLVQRPDRFQFLKFTFDIVLDSCRLLPPVDIAG